MKTNGQHEVIVRIARPGLVLAAVFALVLSGSSVGRAQSSTTSPAIPAAAPAKAAPAAQAELPAAQAGRQRGGNHEGIQVHGYWKIDVKNPDGTVVKHVEFENSLNAQIGGALLMALITGQNPPGAWSVGLEATPASILPCSPEYAVYINLGSSQASSTSIAPCFLGQAGDQYFLPCDGKSCLTTLSVTAPTASLQAVTLQGQMTVTNSGFITAVDTMLMTCSPGVSPAACPTTVESTPSSAVLPPLVWQEVQDAGFTAADLPFIFPFGLPLTRLSLGTTATGCGATGQVPCQVSVQPQQTVAVTVQITFTSGS
jgi:hypothetical protein